MTALQSLRSSPPCESYATARFIIPGQLRIDTFIIGCNLQSVEWSVNHSFQEDHKKDPKDMGVFRQTILERACEEALILG